MIRNAWLCTRVDDFISLQGIPGLRPLGRFLSEELRAYTTKTASLTIHCHGVGEASVKLKEKSGMLFDQMISKRMKVERSVRKDSKYLVGS